MRVCVVEDQDPQPRNLVVTANSRAAQLFPSDEISVGNDWLAHPLQFTSEGCRHSATRTRQPGSSAQRYSHKVVPKVGFVVNPVGGSGKSLKAWESIHQAFPRAVPYFTTEPNGGAAQAERALAEGCDIVAAVGGDGTVNEVGNALIHKNAALAVIPAGTGNDYARTLGLELGDPLHAAKLAFEGESFFVDVGEVIGHRHFLNIAGVGFDAEVMTRFNSPSKVWRALPVKARYYLSILRTFAGYKGVKATVTTDGETSEVKNLLLLAVGCAQFYGAGMHVLPTASLDDGLFDVVWGEDVRLSELNKLMALIYKGDHIGHPNVRHRQCHTLSIETWPPTRFHLDGDVTGEAPVTFVTKQAALRVVRPSSA